MFRKLFLLAPVLAAGLLAGCVTDYAYRGYGGRGDYYYGRPSVEYRYYGAPYGGYYSPYGYGHYGYGYPYRYGYPYPYRYGGYPYGYPNRYPHYRGHGPRPPATIPHGPGPVRPSPPPVQRDRDTDKAPWRNIGGMQRRIESARRPANADRTERHEP